MAEAGRAAGCGARILPLLRETSMDCRICGNAADNPEYLLREQTFALGDQFAYFLCSSCGCLQIADDPADLARYYGDGYYSLHAPRASTESLTQRIKLARCRLAYFGRRPVSTVAHSLIKNEKHRALLRLSPVRDGAILDVGCGTALFLRDLARIGFANLTGIDPHLPLQFEAETPVRVLRRSLVEMSGSFSVVMFHHSFEHLPDPLAALQAVHRLLAPGGACLIRIPTVSSYAWEHYGADWVQLDVPRHLFLHSVGSLRLLADQADFDVTEWYSDSTAMQFWGSEQLRRGIALESTESWGKGNRTLFSRAEMRSFKRETARLNRHGRGDQAAFYLRRKCDRR